MANTPQTTVNGNGGPLLLCIKGAQGSGKDKQAELFEATLREKGYRPATLQMSTILDRTGNGQVRDLMVRGDPVPCGLLKPLFEEAMEQAIREGHDALIANGYPRYTNRQVDDFAELAQRYGCQTIIVRIRATPELCKGRIVRRAQEMLEQGQSPRPDDLNPEAVENRLRRYFNTRPYVSRRLLVHHRFPHVTVTANDALTKEQLHERIVRQMWPPAPRVSPAWAVPAFSAAAA
jgi:adenylate kinase family enzyme